MARESCSRDLERASADRFPIDRPGRGAGIAPKVDVFGDRQRGNQRKFLIDRGHPCRPGIHRVAEDLELALKEYLAFFRLVDACDALGEGRFS